jgi:hypothetical protein
MFAVGCSFAATVPVLVPGTELPEIADYYGLETSASVY